MLVAWPPIYLCRICPAEFLSPRVSALRHVDDMVRKMKVDDYDVLFGEFLVLGRGDGLSVGSRDQLRFIAICRSL